MGRSHLTTAGQVMRCSTGQCGRPATDILHLRCCSTWTQMVRWCSASTNSGGADDPKNQSGSDYRDGVPVAKLVKASGLRWISLMWTCRGRDTLGLALSP